MSDVALPFDALQAAELRRDDGIARAEAHAEPPFNQVALELLREYAEHNRLIHCDGFLDAMEGRLPETHNLRALGAVYRRAASAGVICKTRDAKPSRRSNMSLKPIWVSLVYRGNL